MADKQIYILHIDEYFKQLIHPLTQNEQKQLEENIVKDGCREPLCIWGNTIVDGHNRYEICTRLKIPFQIQNIYFNTREDVIAWICANQLGRRNISEETRKYLIGKRYETEKRINVKNALGKNQHSEKEIMIAVYPTPQRKENKGLTAERLGDEYHISQTTVKKYGNYAKAIDTLAKKEPELISEILTGKIKISHKSISKLSKQSYKIVTDAKNQLSDNDFVSYSNARKIIPVKKEKVTVKDMPAYDPDAEISSLTLTIPSWISSIDRTLSMADFDKISSKARIKLRNELRKLEYTANVMLLATEEK